VQIVGARWFLFWIWSGVIGPWSKVRVLFIFILFNKMNEDMESKEIAKILLINCKIIHLIHCLTTNCKKSRTAITKFNRPYMRKWKAETVI
jgi:hypothetical protein